MEQTVGKTYSYDGLDDDFTASEFDELERSQHDKQRRKVKRKIEDYLEQKRLRKDVGDSDFDYLE